MCPSIDLLFIYANRPGCFRNSAKGKEAMVDKKGKAVVELGSTPKRPKNYGHFHEDADPTHFCKVILTPKLECMSMPLDFTNHLAIVPEEIVLRTKISYA